MNSGPSSPVIPAPARTHQPKAQLFRVLAILWVFPSLGALVVIGLGWSVWSRAQSIGEALGGTRFEQWIGLLILLLHPSFLVLARHYRRTEVPREVVPEEAAGPPDGCDGPRPS